METFLLVLAALFPVVNPPGSALVFLSMTRHASSATRKSLARRVATNAFFVMAGSLLVGAFILTVYGISVPVLRVAGGLIVAISGWKLLNEGSDKADEEAHPEGSVEYTSQAFYPMTLPLTTGPGTIAVMISLGLSHAAYSGDGQGFQFVLAALTATVVMAGAIYLCFAFSDRMATILGRGGTNIAVRLSAFILFCLGVQIVWTGASDLLGPLLSTRAPTHGSLVTEFALI
jgi:multiple antibiotic resistance protein